MAYQLNRKYDTYFGYNEETGKYDIPHLGFTRKGCGVDTSYTQITKEQYENYQSRPYGEVSREIEDNLSDAVRFGYGYYGWCLYKDEEEDLYFLGKKIGSSCD